MKKRDINWLTGTVCGDKFTLPSQHKHYDLSEKCNPIFMDENKQGQI